MGLTETEAKSQPKVNCGVNDVVRLSDTSHFFNAGWEQLRHHPSHAGTVQVFSTAKQHEKALHLHYMLGGLQKLHNCLDNVIIKTDPLTKIYP